MTEHYEVQKILGKRTNKGKPQYRIKWLGYPESECTWEPEKNLTSCREMLKKYNENLQKSSESAKPTAAKPNMVAQRSLPESRSSNRKPVEEQSQEEEQKRESEEMEEENEEDQYKYKRPVPANMKKGPALRKSLRNRPGSRPNLDEMLEEENNEQLIDQQSAEKEQPKTNSKQKAQISKVQVLGMLQLDKVTYFKIKENGKTSCITRQELLEKDAKSIVMFYEKHMRIIPASI